MNNIYIKILDSIILDELTDEQYEIYLYGIECLCNELIANLILLIIGIFIHHVYEILVWSFTFVLLRTNIGGYHLHTHRSCVIISTLLGITSPLVNNFFGNLSLVYIIVILLCVLIVIFKIAPVVHPNHPISTKRINYLHKRSMFISTFICACTVLLRYSYPSFSYAIYTATIEAVILCIMGYFSYTLKNLHK